jgi:hypothetical protein
MLVQSDYPMPARFRPAEVSAGVLTFRNQRAADNPSDVQLPCLNHLFNGNHRDAFTQARNRGVEPCQASSPSTVKFIPQRRQRRPVHHRRKRLRKSIHRRQS